MSWAYDLLRSAWSIEQTAYPLPHCQQGEVAGIIIFCLAYQFMLLSLTNPKFSNEINHRGSMDTEDQPFTEGILRVSRSS
jgi:hypothetical protein